MTKSNINGTVVQNAISTKYALRDHLGNTRVTFTDGVNKGEPYWDWSNYSYIQPDNTGYDDGVVTEADIKHINHTYPFGMAMEGNWNNAGSANNNKYLYNGKQYNDDFGMGWYDYGARFYDATIARWASIDCKSVAYSSTSPYSYVQNDPINFMDIGGSYKFPAKYANLYRRFYEYLKNNAENDIMNSPRILDGLLKFSGGNLTKTAVQQAVKWGSGPTIEISDAPGGNSNALGHYDGNGVITINTKLVAQLQNATDAQIELLLTSIYKTVLHETVHYGDYLDGARQDGGEPGDAFDGAVFFPMNIYQNSDGTSGASVHPKFSTGEGISTIGAVTEWQQFMANKFPNILKELTPTTASSSTESRGAGKTSTPVAPLPLIKPKPIPIPKPKPQPLPKPKPDPTRA